MDSKGRWVSIDILISQDALIKWFEKVSPKIVDLFAITNQNIKLTVLWKS